MRLKDVDPTCGMTLNECLSSVAEFHSTFGLRVEEQPNLQLTAEEMSLRHSLMAEENDEYLDAVRAGDMVEVADALGDMLYILCGTIISHGMQDVMSNVFRTIQASNMSKLGPDGKPIYRADRKVLKGPGYFKPDIAGALKEAGANSGTMNAWVAQRADKALQEARAGNPKALDRLMRVALPFNRPHRIGIIEVNEEAVKVSLPERRSNRNHLGGMHACAIATALEFSSGASVLIELGMRDYRIIMSRIEVDYLAKPQGNCTATSKRNTPEVQGLSDVLQKEGVARVQLSAALHDARGEHCAQALVHWHLKVWGNRG